MKTISTKTLSIVPIAKAPKARTTEAVITTLTFIHRFRHVTVYHVQRRLGHTDISSTYKHLRGLCAKGLIDRHPGSNEHNAKEVASYYLTPAGLNMLKVFSSSREYRSLRSIKIDASMSARQRERYHVLADTYGHFKQHYNEQFAYFTAHDLSRAEHIPEELPDGYVRLMLPFTDTMHYFIEIYGWGRATHIQQRRLASYVAYAESENGPQRTGLFIVVPDARAQMRLYTVLTEMLRQSFAEAFPIFTVVASKLDETAVWKQVS